MDTLDDEEKTIDYPGRRRPWVAVGAVIAVATAVAAGLFWWSGRIDATLLDQESTSGPLDCDTTTSVSPAGDGRAVVTGAVVTPVRGELAISDARRDGAAAELTVGWSRDDVFHEAAADCIKVRIAVPDDITSATIEFR